ncbi:MAG: hypothetical protein ACJA1A_001858 [Saprospiraceae bacterium]|jgi:uncharacterized protein YjdB
MKTLKLLIFSTLLLFVGSMSAQVTGVNYQLKYDTVDCQYDALLIINAGDASSISERVQFNSQFSVIVPTGTTVDVDTSYMPLLNNSTYTGTEPIAWQKGSVVSNDPALPGYDFISITPYIDLQTYHYNDLDAGDTIKLFSLNTSPITNCGDEIRMYENGADPTSSDLAGGNDFYNGFTVGSTEQLYEANSTEQHPPAPTLVSLTNECGNGIEIDLTAYTSDCQGPLTFEWEGPDSYSSVTEDVVIQPALPVNNGLYSVTITDAFGCTTVATIDATSKPNAGADQVMCAGETITLSGNDPTTGTWSQQAGNSAGVSLNSLPGGQVQVSMSNSASSAAPVNGVYNLIYAIPGCSDTMSITVNPKPLTLIQGANNICVFDSVRLISNIAGGIWSANNPAVATINATTGWATGVSQGTATFTYTTTDGCTAVSPTLTINPQPIVTNTGSDTICVGSFTQLTPQAGGTWNELDGAIASVTAGGLVEGLADGTAGFQFLDNASGCLSDTIFVTVIPVPVVVFAGNDSLCVGGMTQVSPTVGVTWTSSNTNVLTINNQGQITGVGVGTAIVTVTDLASGCVSDASPTIWVLDAPTVAITGPTNICIGDFSQATPTTGGTWVSSNDGVATITDGGIITAQGAGPVEFTFTETATGCSTTTETLIVETPPSVNVDFATICIGGFANLTPAIGGTWAALEPDTASVSGNVVEGHISGTAGFVFTSSSTGCESDTIFITVEPGATVSITGDDEICIGETTTLDSDGEVGSWTSSDPTIASVTNAGVVTGVNSGQAIFTFTSNATLCKSDPTPPVTVYPAPIITLDDSNLCIGETTFANSTAFGGTWSSSDDTVAEIDEFTGEITAIADGSATFTYLDPFTNCSTTSGILVVNQSPDVSITGAAEICENETTQLSPTTGGVWASLQPAIATVNNNGLVTGVSAGTVQLVFTETTTGCASDTLVVTILGATPVTDPVDDELCIGETTTVTPIAGGTWVSSAPLVASITNAGVITALTSGSAIFTFTSSGSAQCASNSTGPVVVNPAPTIVLGATEVCVGETTTATTSTAGKWTSTDTLVATIDSITGLITGIAPGITTFTFVDDLTGCSSPETADFTVGEPALVTSGASQICVGEQTNVFPSTGGTWTSSDPTIAGVDNDGLVTGVSPGSVVFYYTEAGGCTSAPTDSTEVTPGPTTDIGADDELCIGETIQILPAAGGTWVSSDVLVATITNGGLVTAIGPGVANFTFTSNTTGCSSQPTDPVTVNGPATTIITGSDVICIGATTTMSPTSGGVWVSNDTNIATIDATTGVVTGIAEGSTTFVFTPNDTGCPSDDSDPVSVSPSPTATLLESNLCVGANTILSPTENGTWTSSDPSIATVLDNGEVTALAPGIVTFTFTETASGCASADATDPLTITDCLKPDFNATFVNISVEGDASTNDGVPVGSTYGPTPVLTGSPAGAIFTLTVNSDGTYSFISDMIGVYTWNVPVCIPPLVAGCQTAELVITVVDFLDPDNKPIANVDIASTQINTDVTLISLANDKCVVVGGCDLDPAITIITQPENGTVVVDGLTGNTTYSPDAGYVGLDTLRYQVCVLGEPGNCAQANQIITILSASAGNTTFAADDFNSGGQDTPIVGDVSSNDTDPEGDVQTVTAQVTPIAGVGTLTLATDGTYTFVPEETFYGPVDFPYVTCDDNGTQACANATLHLLVVRDLYVQVRVYLQGAFINNENAIGSHTRPLMRDDLRESSFTGSRYIPDTEPYSTYKSASTDMNPPQHWETIGDFESENFPFYKYGYDVTSQETKFLTVPDPATIFATSGEDAVTDWVSVELRSKADNTLILAQRAGLVQRDGDVMDLNGESGLRFKGVDVDDYFVVVRHRNHLGAMTATSQSPEKLADLVDFTLAATGFFDFGAGKNIYDYTGLSQSPLSGSPASNKTGYLALWGGDFDADSKIKFTNPEDDLNNLFGNVFLYEIVPGLEYNFFTNFDFAFGYQTGDYDMNSKAKFDNPNDDKNYLFGQLLFYPLNADFRSNFDFFIEQIPEALIAK